MDYEDLSTAGQSTPTSRSRPPSLPSPGSGSGGPDQRKILMFAMVSGLVMVVALLAFVGLPAWMIGVIVVGDLIAMRVLFSRLPPPR